ncbi:hypothetical protein EKO27_g9869 [Xylaria grammica]|uniref:Protein EFR3 n=1 Tax=Xylaria grammica TaxID=363999 RepID=A0A439CSZ8_9PEZI|nr:hypothetical protein EKO27_g9869 [Xylaria grammica]
MNAIQQKCRPKHQVLVLKCYPRTTKGAVDIKPNSSELSYLLFYATSRRSKIQKISQFLEKKTASDVWRLRIGNVQVTLQILAALIEKSPKDLPLFAQDVLKILGLILRSNDITMVEASLPTFETFCEHHDVSSLFADQAYLHQYEEVVHAYAACASTRLTPGRGTPSKAVALRWRNAGLGAIKSVATSDTLSSVSGRQLDVLVPMVLENLWTDDEDFLDVLLQRAQMEEKVDSNALLRRRTSVSTVRTAETGGDTNPIAISGTSGDIDKLAEEDTGVEAMQCLKQIFVIPNRAQLHGATTALLKFTRERISQKEVVVKPRSDGRQDGGWAIKIFDLITRWAPVQDRYAIMITAMDAMLRTPPSRENLDEQIVLAAIISSLLRSDINLIGLSVIDVLLGLIQHMKRTLRYCAASRDGTVSSTSREDEPVADSREQISSQQRNLLDRIQQCMGDLATHVYYADQISDMISAILSQLKPHPSAPEFTTTTDKPANPTGSAASTANVSEEQFQLDSYFAKDLAKTTALRAIRSILLIANPKTKLSGNISLRRNKVPIQVWDGTQWLLRDPDGQVRKAYADAVITWLDRETTRADLTARDELHQDSSRVNNREVLPANAGRRAVSNASNREKPARPHRSYFLLLLHLAIYDTALQYIEFDTDVALLHILLTKLVVRLGVNAARFGLPMVFRLQEDIQEVETPLSKVRLGCLCHGYFWAASEQFDFESSVIGRAIQSEIARRRSKGFWVEGVHIPTPLLQSIGTPGSLGQQRKISVHEIESEALLPFDDRSTMVDCICTNYRDGAASPPVSPAASPSRGFSSPILSSTLSTIPPINGQEELPVKFREEMLMEWTRETAIATIQEGSKSASLSGSKTGTTATKKNRLAVNGPTANGHGSSRPGSAYAAHNNLRPSSNAGTHGARKSSVRSRSSGQSGSVRGVVASVEQLKSALTGETARPQTFHTVQEDDISDDSMVSYEFAPSEASFNPQTSEGNDTNEASQAQARPKSREQKVLGDSGGPLTSHPMDVGDHDEDEVPPVPPLPASYIGKSPELDTRLEPSLRVSLQDPGVKTTKRSLKSREGESIVSGSFTDADATGTMDLHSLLRGIDSKSRQNTIGNLTRPPY